MSFLSKFAKIGEDRLSFNQREEPEYDSKRFRPRKALEKFEKLISRFEPAQIATRFLNSLMPVPEVMAPNVNTGLGVTPITANDITITGYAVSTASSFSPGISVTANANVEVGFDLSGAAYQSLINGMLSRANAGALQVATQVDPLATYSVQFGFSIGGNSRGPFPTFRNSSFVWEGAFQVFDSVTGQGSMAYGWTGRVDNPLNPGEVLALIAASGTRPSTAQATFNQPPATTALPQQIVAFEYVENFIGQTPSNLWPPVVYGTPFDPIPANQTFTPASFPAV
ncbi:hypothetical protein NZK27_03210 [Synechococcus sp. FGCU-3]|nr:hypothetical protein [Synechococcus sp. FGCU3]